MTQSVEKAMRTINSRIDKFEAAVEAYVNLGCQRPEDEAAIVRNYHRARTNLENMIRTKLTQAGE